MHHQNLPGPSSKISSIRPYRLLSVSSPTVFFCLISNDIKPNLLYLTILTYNLLFNNSSQSDILGHYCDHYFMTLSLPMNGPLSRVLILLCEASNLVVSSGFVISSTIYPTTVCCPLAFKSTLFLHHRAYHLLSIILYICSCSALPLLSWQLENTW